MLSGGGWGAQVTWVAFALLPRAMSPLLISSLNHDRSLNSLAAVAGRSRRRHDVWSASYNELTAPRARDCYKSLTIECLDAGRTSARTARVMTNLRPPTTTDRAAAHDGAMFRRLEDFFRARRAELRAGKLSTSA